MKSYLSSSILQLKYYKILGKHIIEPDLELCDETLSGIMVLRSAKYGYLAAVKNGEVLRG